VKFGGLGDTNSFIPLTVSVSERIPKLAGLILILKFYFIAVSSVRTLAGESIS